MVFTYKEINNKKCIYYDDVLVVTLDKDNKDLINLINKVNVNENSIDRNIDLINKTNKEIRNISKILLLSLIGFIVTALLFKVITFSTLSLVLFDILNLSLAISIAVSSFNLFDKISNQKELIYINKTLKSIKYKLNKEIGNILTKEIDNKKNIFNKRIYSDFKNYDLDYSKILRK